jgi:predicted O-methyltransferase YrrM
MSHVQPSSEQLQHATALLHRAQCLLQSGQIEESFKVILDLKAQRVPLMQLDLCRAICFAHMGRIPDAVQSLREELRFFPHNEDARQLLEELLKVQGQQDSSLNASHDPEFMEIYQAIRNHTMLSVARLYNLFIHAKRICEENIPGNFVECGVAAGGSSVLLAYVIRRYSRIPRIMWCFDSFSGMPPARAEDAHGGVPAEQTGWGSGTCAAPLQSLQSLARSVGVGEVIRPVVGFFEETLKPHRDRVGMIALLHLDGDWYSSTRTILENLYDRVSDKGILQIDDFGYWDGCRKAVQEFFQARKLTPLVTRIDDTGVWLEKPDLFPINPTLPNEMVQAFCAEDVGRYAIPSQMSPNERFQLYWAFTKEMHISAGQREIRFLEIGSYAGASLLQSYVALRHHGLPIDLVTVEPQGQPEFYAIVQELQPITTHLKMFSDAAAPILADEIARTGRLFDAMVIDGDHTYAGVKKDIELFFPLLRPGGLMLFHDYLPALNDENREAIFAHHASTEPGIRRACDEYFAGNADAQEVTLPLLRPSDPTQTQAYLQIIPGVFSTVRAWRKRR